MKTLAVKQESCSTLNFKQKNFKQKKWKIKHSPFLFIQKTTLAY
ncbi:hypothetical protein H4V97_000441 [Flavobacterium sp. CG_23.5]|nr:hypothetical protein [Flavobacterium sp. CG_9.10]MBP2282123.1 hypothetical protein [Flavobacterium sp. CG_23.5]